MRRRCCPGSPAGIASANATDALVAAWLPGSEGKGVSDTLFGRKPYTGRLSLTWPKTVAQEPINVGDASYDPLYPFGWGLRTVRRGRGAACSMGRAPISSPLTHAVASSPVVPPVD